jgi:putative ABC transport system permease protein
LWLLDRPAPPPGQQLSIDFLIVSNAYFRTLGIPIVAGRVFTEQDTIRSPRVVVVSSTAAQRYWPAGNAIGQRVRFGGKEAEVVGLVGDVRQRDPARPPEPLLYTSLQQDNEFWNFILLSVFSAVALLLAAIGTYGVMAYSVTRRTREIGVRMALGARPGDVLRMVISQGAGLVAAAVTAGIAGALVTNRLLAQQLFDVSATDPATLAAGAATLGTFALIACYVPARKAMKIEPTEALRTE